MTNNVLAIKKEIMHYANEILDMNITSLKQLSDNTHALSEIMQNIEMPNNILNSQKNYRWDDRLTNVFPIYSDLKLNSLFDMYQHSNNAKITIEQNTEYIITFKLELAHADNQDPATYYLDITRTSVRTYLKFPKDYRRIANYIIEIYKIAIELKYNPNQFSNEELNDIIYNYILPVIKNTSKANKNLSPKLQSQIINKVNALKTLTNNHYQII